LVGAICAKAAPAKAMAAMVTTATKSFFMESSEVYSDWG
jgi:hypothetical protein